VFSAWLQIETFATKYGERAVTFLGSGLLLSNYIGAITVSVSPNSTTSTLALFHLHLYMWVPGFRKSSL
jgi:hypothetical protein